jgi:hypothetical protein
LLAVTRPQRDEIEDRLRSNFARVDNLVAIYEERAAIRPGRASVGDADLLRAAVVFLHATLEDVVRSVLETRWPNATDPELFERVSFVLPTDSRRLEKLGVGDLARHLRGKSVDEVVRDAVHGYLKHSSFNNVADIVLALKRAEIGPELLTPFAREIMALMQRRHWIVHRADRNEHSGPGHHVARSISLANVRNWRAHVEPVCRAILARV